MEKKEQEIYGGCLGAEEHVRQFNKDNGFMTNILLENLVTSN